MLAGNHQDVDDAGAWSGASPPCPRAPVAQDQGVGQTTNCLVGEGLLKDALAQARRTRESQTENEPAQPRSMR